MKRQQRRKGRSRSRRTTPRDSRPVFDWERKYLARRIRPLTLDDMVPGLEYVPGLTVLEVELPATADHGGALFSMPIEVPEHLREPTSENVSAVFGLVYRWDVRSRATIDYLYSLARPRSAETQGEQSRPTAFYGEFVKRPRPRTAPNPERAQESAATDGNR